MDIFTELKKDLQNSKLEIDVDNSIWDIIKIEYPQNPLNGDIATNIIFEIARKNSSLDIKEIGLSLKKSFEKISYISNIEIAKQGFMNFTIIHSKWFEYLDKIIKNNVQFLYPSIGNGEKINVEYVSANPTGPMHIGHARGAVFGDVLSNILSVCGYNVVREFYINDAGAQIEKLTESVIIRYKEICLNKTLEMSDGLYPGEYLKDVAGELFEKYNNKLLDLTEDNMKEKVRTFSVDAMLKLIKSDLKKLGVEHDIFFSELSLHKEGKIEETIDILKKRGLTDIIALEHPKNFVHSNNDAQRKQLVFRSTIFGDDKDRALQKDDGSWSYLASDIAYAKNKIDRKFSKLIYILGFDHIGYVNRIKFVISALSENNVEGVVLLNQIVSFIEDGKPMKMSKRSGNFITVDDVVSSVNKDIVRFMMISRSNDTVLDFDFQKVQEESKNNPVFYVQYAYVRTKSILKNAEINENAAFQNFINGKYDLSLLSSAVEIDLIKLLILWPHVLKLSAKNYQPHQIIYYLIELASKFHSLWNLGKSDREYVFVSSNEKLTTARLALVKAVQKIITECFNVVRINLVENM